MNYDIGPLGRLPAEMRALPQWVLAGADKVPLTANESGELRACSATRPSDWMTFERALAVAWMHKDLVTTHVTKEGVTITEVGLKLGFVLHEADPFSCIDLDTKDAETHPDKPALWTTAADFDRYLSIIGTMDSYTERSRSGKGIHVWVKGKIGRGFRRDGVEVYSQERYMICTGDVYVDKPVQERGEMLRNMVAQMRPVNRVGQTPLVELEPQHDDWYVFSIAATAANADKFWSLWRGQWEGDFESHSHADLALMSMFTFYSDSNAQCRRLFRQSQLGKREKTAKNDYHVNKMLMLIRDRQEREAAVEYSAILKTADEVASLRAAVAEAQGGVAATVAGREVVQLTVPGQGNPVQAPPPQASALAQLAPVPPGAVVAGEQGLPWPPGFVGKVAQFIYANSYLPIKEVSVVAALGLMAGLCGKAWHIPKSGLNLYIILVARSAIGKESMHDGISTLVSACQPLFPPFGNFVDFSEHVSGPALIKAVMQNPSVVNVCGEFGRRLKRMAEDTNMGPISGLRTQMTNLYQKSAPSSVAGGLTYSDQESNVASLQGVAYSMIGESTPGTFYEALTPAMMEDGFLSRFLIIGYDGDRPAKNQVVLDRPDDALTRALVDLATQANDHAGKGTSMSVGRDEQAALVMAKFEAEADRMITSTNDESRRQMWNRAHLKAMRIAALLAVGDNYLSPCIRKEHFLWAEDLIRRDIAMMQKRLDSGDVGADDVSRERKIVTVLKDYVQADSISPGYKVPPQMHKDGIVPRGYLQVRTNRAACFYSHKLGTTKALDETLAHLIANGCLMEVKHDKVVELYSHHGKAYRIIELPNYVEQSLK